MSNPRKVDAATEADWSFMQNPDILLAATQAAKAVAGKYAGVMVEEDLYQDALLYLAVSRPMVEANMADPDKGVTYINWRLRSYLEDVATPQVSRSNRTVSREAWEGGPS